MRFASRRRAQLHLGLTGDLGQCGRAMIVQKGDTTPNWWESWEMFGHENGRRKMIQVDQRCRFFLGGGKSELLLSEAVRTGESASSRAGVWMPGS